MTAAPETPRTLIDELLAEQQELTAVARFSRKHAGGELPAQARYYRELLPLEKPRTGEQYAFGVDLDACTGCKACVSACHSLNGLDEDETWRNVGFIHGGDRSAPYQQTTTSACHHCVDPACLNGCPVAAYEKDDATGIVRHLDDQCIGCQYCVLKCPYDVPKYSKARGIVRKCDMCHSRLAANEAPACVQACPNGAITIRVVNKAEFAASTVPADRLLPDTFSSAYTIPTTRYTTRKSVPKNTRASDAHALRLEHAHWPLILMLVLTQMSAGLFIALAVFAFGSAAIFNAMKAPLAVAGFAILNAGLGVSVLHLGKPLGAWRFFLGLRTSWMSREILAFSVFAAAAGACTLATVWDPISGWWPVLTWVEKLASPASFAAPLAVVTALLGLIGVACSAMIYIDTHRPFWTKELTLPKFFGTTFLLGASGCACVLAWVSIPHSANLSTRILAAACGLLQLGLNGWEARKFRTSLDDDDDPAHRSALAMRRLLRSLLDCSAMLSLTAFAAFACVAAGSGLAAALAATLALALSTAARIIERYSFFTAVVAPRMPGGFAA